MALCRFFLLSFCLSFISTKNSHPLISTDYMIAAYGPYSASATGGNGWSRDFLAGVLTVPATPFYTNIGRSKGRNLEYASTILFCIATVLVAAVYVIYWKGPVLRKRSPFAQQLDAERKGAPERNGHKERLTGAHKRPVSGLGSRQNSYYTSQNAVSRNASRNASRNVSRNPSRNVSRANSLSGDSSDAAEVPARTA